MRICIADSNPHMRKLLCDLLSHLDVSEIKACKDGREALDVLKTFAADLCIVELNMQPMDGMAMLKHLRTTGSGRTRALSVIMVADSPVRDAVVEAHAQGSAEFLLKPVTIPALYARIQGSIGPRQRADAAEIKPTREPAEVDRMDYSTSITAPRRVASTTEDGILELKE